MSENLTSFNSKTGRVAAEKRWSEYTPQPKIVEPGFRLVYMIEAGTAIKIGHTKNLSERISNLQGANPETLIVVFAAYTGTPLQLEQNLHEYFADRRIRGEWFDISRDEALAAMVSLYTYD